MAVPRHDLRRVVRARRLVTLAESGADLSQAFQDIIIAREVLPKSAFLLTAELEVYAEAGISNADVLKIATLDSARIVGVSDKTGSISVGKASDMILVDGNPLNDSSASRRATLVMKGDTLYRPDELYEAVGVKPFVGASKFQIR